MQTPTFGLDTQFVDAARGVVTRWIGRVLVAGAATDALVAARAERPLAGAAGALGPGAVAGEQDDADVRRAARVIEHAIQLVDGVRTKGVEHLGTIERHTHTTEFATAVVRDVGEILEPLDGGPRARVEGVLGLPDGFVRGGLTHAVSLGRGGDDPIAPLEGRRWRPRSPVHPCDFRPPP